LQFAQILSEVPSGLGDTVQRRFDRLHLSQLVFWRRCGLTISTVEFKAFGNLTSPGIPRLHDGTISQGRVDGFIPYTGGVFYPVRSQTDACKMGQKPNV
jgi:hypothetical protein